MEKRVLLAVVLSVMVIIIFNYLYVKFIPSPQPTKISQNQSNNIEIKKEEPLKKEIKPEEIKISQVSSEELKNYILISPQYEVSITSLGARFNKFQLKNYSKEKNKKEPVNLISSPSEGLPLEIYLSSAPEVAVINYRGPEKNIFSLENATSQTISFLGSYKNITLEKTFTFKRNSYFIDLSFRISNQGNEVIKDGILLRGVFSPFVDGTKYVFKGPFYYTDHLNEIKLKKDLEDYTGNLKYLGYEDTYFMVALIPQNMGNATYRATFRNIDKNTQEFILWLPPFELKPNEEITYNFKLYMGPKKIEEMKKEYPLLGKALYFGIFDFIAKPLLYILKFSHRFTGNFGWDIIFITILLRILFFPLNQISYKSMKRMQEIQPIIQKLREKYKDDPQTLNKELMNVYKSYKINPFSGCLPILIQIPIFIAFYKVLLMAIELRHAPFMLWIDDLSAPERLYIGNFHIPYLGGIPLLTILMGASMFVQQKLSPSTTDPFQNRLMLLMPLFFIILFINFPSGLVLYWFVNNILSIIQQYFTLKLLKK
ncbi:MAG: membrane protein insertase YidC [Thermodesulfobacterium geofontis]|uniref:Membrane protein insertase YidC n=2 Tax=Thermodesulfobacterium geofontis TaxID=1295609 RepID=A0A2N7PPN9_9BACT|nr:MAG: membrane protein insertase YidC [Thermodesulfobacterium geofontis]